MISSKWRSITGVGTLARGSAAWNAGILSASSVLLQVVTLSVYPILTRLYSPADFGVAATISTLYTMLCVLASGMGETAIVLTKSRTNAAAVMVWVFRRATLVLALFASICGCLFAAGLLDMLDKSIVALLPVVPLLAAVSVLFACASEFAVREGRFSSLAQFRFLQGFSIVGSRLGLGAVFSLQNGLVLGELLGKAIGAAWSVRRTVGGLSEVFRKANQTRVRRVRKRYRSMSNLSVFENLLSVGGGGIYVPIIGAAYGIDEVGYVAVVMSALYLPVTVVSTAVKDVFRRRAVAELAATGSCRSLYFRALRPVFLLGVLGFGLLYVSIPWLLPIFLGPGWGVVVEYSTILIPMFFFNFVSMSLGGVFVAVHRVDVAVWWQAINLLATALMMIGAVLSGAGVETTLMSMAVTRIVSYLLFMALSVHYGVRRR